MVGLSILLSGWLAVGCGSEEDPLRDHDGPTATSTMAAGGSIVIPTPIIEIINPRATQAPFAERRDGSFPVNLRPPAADVDVWTTIRRAGDAEADAELMVITEGFVEPAIGFVFEYEIIYADADGNTYDTEPDLQFGLMEAGERRRFGVAAMMPTGSRLTEIRLTALDGNISRRLVYHVSLRVANIPRTALLPSGYDTAQ
jgi:hypothetical protein